MQIPTILFPLVKKMKILLVNPNFHSGGPENIVGTLPPLGLLYIGGSLIKGGYSDIELIDLNTNETDLKNDSDIGEYITKKNPTILFIGGMASTASLSRSIAISQKIKEINNEIKIVLGGTHPTFMYKEIMENHPCIDFIIRGEGELTCQKLIDCLVKNLDIAQVKGLVWRNPKNGGDTYIVNDENSEIADLDEFSPAWNLIKNWEYYRAPANNEITATFQFSRGCNHRCIFCGQWQLWKKWHSRSVKSLVDEVEFLYTHYGVTFFFWADENPAQDQNKWIEVLNGLKTINDKYNNKFHHMLNTRVDHVIRDEKYLPLYREAGIFAIDLGMESAIQQRLNYFNKKTTTDLNKRSLELLRSHDIISIVQVLIGSPDETMESLQKTGLIFQEWNPDLMHFYFTTPFPWTEFGKSMEDKIVEPDYSKWDYRHPIIKPDGISLEQLSKMSKWIKLEFNYNPKKILDIMQIDDDYRQKFLINSIIQSLKYRSGNSKLSVCE